MIPNNIVRTAYKQALKAEHRFRIGAIIFRNNYIAGRGYNKPHKTHPKSNHPFHTIHAEFDAIIDFLVRHTKGTIGAYNLYVHRISRNNDSPALSRPCVHCVEMLRGYGLKEVFYSTSNGIRRMNL